MYVLKKITRSDKNKTKLYQTLVVHLIMKLLIKKELKFIFEF